MTPARFRDLCAGLYRMAGEPVPDFGSINNAFTAVGVRLEDVDVLIEHDGCDRPSEALVTVDFGPLPRQGQLAICRALMEVNSLMLGKSTCTLASDPLTGRILLHYAYPLENTSVGDLHVCLRELAEVAQGWRKHWFLGPSGSGPFDSPALRG